MKRGGERWGPIHNNSGYATNCVACVGVMCAAAAAFPYTLKTPAAAGLPAPAVYPVTADLIG